jgi:hypothetical protein
MTLSFREVSHERGPPRNPDRQTGRTGYRLHTQGAGTGSEHNSLLVLGS